MARKNEFGITELQERFCDEYLRDLNGKKAMLAVRPGLTDKTAAAQASKWLNIPGIAAYMNWKRAGAAKKNDLTIEKVMAELAKIGFSNMSRFTKRIGKEIITDFSETTDDDMAAVQEVTVETYTEGRGDDAETVKKIKFKLGDKRGALVDLGRHLGAFPRDGGIGKNSDEDGDGPDLKVVVAGGLPEDE